MNQIVRQILMFVVAFVIKDAQCDSNIHKLFLDDEFESSTFRYKDYYLSEFEKNQDLANFTGPVTVSLSCMVYPSSFNATTNETT